METFGSSSQPRWELLSVLDLLQNVGFTGNRALQHFFNKTLFLIALGSRRVCEIHSVFRQISIEIRSAFMGKD